MADRATQIVNFYESTLASSLIGASGTGTTLSQAPTTDGTSTISATLGDEDTWYYLVVAPDTAGSREVIVVKASSGTTITNVGRDIEGRYTSTALPEHTSGTIVRLAVLAEHMEDLNDRVDAVSTVANAAIPVADIQDDDLFASATATDVASSESIKTYVDTQVATKASLGLVIALG